MHDPHSTRKFIYTLIKIDKIVIFQTESVFKIIYNCCDDESLAWRCACNLNFLLL